MTDSESAQPLGEWGMGGTLGKAWWDEPGWGPFGLGDGAGGPSGGQRSRQFVSREGFRSSLAKGNPEVGCKVLFA